MAPKSLWMAPRSLGMAPKSLGMAPRYLGMAPKSLWMAPKSLWMTPKRKKSNKTEFLSTGPILDLNVSLKRSPQNLKLGLSKDTPRDDRFLIFFLILFSLGWLL